MVTCLIGIGSNLGDRQYYINTAIKKIKLLLDTRINKISRTIESLPQGGPPQSQYLNAVIQIETDFSPYQLLKELQNIEYSLGRVRTMKNAPRTIDLDILTYGDISINEDALCLPHPRILERDFVVQPLREIAPEVAKKLLRKKSGIFRRAHKQKKRKLR